MKSPVMLVCVFSLAAWLTACGGSLETSFEGFDEWVATPTPLVGFDRPPPSNTCPGGSIVLNIADCPIFIPPSIQIPPPGY